MSDQMPATFTLNFYAPEMFRLLLKLERHCRVKSVTRRPVHAAEGKLIREQIQELLKEMGAVI
jgi:hypothetical protein